jgi:MFS family permease
MNDADKTPSAQGITIASSGEGVSCPPIPTDVSGSPWSFYSSRQRWGYLAILFLVSTSNYLDRNVLSVLLEPIKHEFHVSDTLLGLLSGFCFALFYAVAGMPVARWADHGNRRTIITLAVMTWSVMTMICGLAQAFWQLAIARVGVGAGESGAIPPAQSLIADYFPPEHRAKAFGIFDGAATAGYVLGVGVGGYIAATYGWRSAFLLAGMPGLLLALVVRCTLAEPRLQRQRQVPRTSEETLREAISKLSSKSSYRYAVASCIAYWFFAYGALTFIPSLLIRVLHATLTQVSVEYGTVAAVASIIGALSGGWLADRLARRDIRWLAWLPGIVCTLAGPIYLLAFSADSLRIFLVLTFIALVLLGGGLPPVYAAIHAVCGGRRRATAIAIVFFSATLLGGGFGPLASGALSDSLSAIYGVAGLRFALMIMTVWLAVSGAASYFFGRAMPGDLED